VGLVIKPEFKLNDTADDIANDVTIEPGQQLRSQPKKAAQRSVAAARM
jgi:hypothetical protein